jgi:hypothetical protein
MASTPRQELLLLVVLVLAVDAGFVAAYFLGRIADASDMAKVGFTAVWTLATLVIVLRGLARMRGARSRARGR